MALKEASARKWIKIVKTNNMFQLQRNLLFDTKIIDQSQWFPYMRDHYNLKGRSLLYCAIYFNQYTMVEFLLTNYPACYRECETSLYLVKCCEPLLYEKFDMFVLLLMKHPIPFQTVLRVLTKSHHKYLPEQCLAFLFQLYEGDLFTSCNNREEFLLCRTLMHIAIYQRLENIIRLLLEYGFDPNVIHDNSTCLHWTILSHRQNSESAIVNLFIQYGAFVNIENETGHRPIDHVDKNYQDEIMQCLLQHGSLLPRWRIKK